MARGLSFLAVSVIIVSCGGFSEDFNEGSYAMGEGKCGEGILVVDEEELEKINPPPAGTVFVTEEGHRVDHNGDNVTVYGPPTKDGTYPVWGTTDGDANPSEDDVDDWHFGDGPCFVLPDGTQIMVDSSEPPPSSLIIVVDTVSVVDSKRAFSSSKSD